ncbi:MAG: RidA family protein [Gemmatimonadales bacterium]
MHRSVAATCGGFVLAGAFVLGGRVGHRASAPGAMDSWSVSSAGEFVYVSGVVGRRPGSQELPDGIEAQVRQALENVRAALSSEGLDLSHVVSSNVFLSDARNFQAMNEVYRTYFPNDPPTRATVEADLPVPGALVQLTMVAARREVSRRVITPGGMQSPGLPYSWGILAGNTLFIAGATSRNPTTYQPEGGDVASQTRRVMQNIGKVLDAADMDYGDVVGCKVFLSDARDFRAMSEVYSSFFPAPRPARATVRARLMNPAFRTEVQCVAVNDPSRRAVVAGGGPSPTGPFSPAIQVGDRLFLAGMLGRGPEGYAPGDARAQTRQALENILRTLEAGGLSFDDVVDVAVWITDIRTARAVEQIVRETVPDRPVTVVGSGLMSTAGLVEIMMTAER